jgi:hypothetical protein
MTTSYENTSLERIEFQPLKPELSSVPLVIDDWTLAFRLGFTGKTFWYVHGNRNDLYKVFKQKKASGGLRTIHNPNPLMRLIAKQLRARILLPLCERLGAHVGAYQVGKSTLDTAKMHLFPCVECDKLDQVHTCQLTLDDTGSKYKILRLNQDSCIACSKTPKHDCPRRGVKIHMDLKDFFTSTRRAWIRQYFHEAVGYNHYVSALLAQLLTVDFKPDPTQKKSPSWSGVPQGSPASGDICNLVADWRLDSKILTALPDWRYTRYADDLFFSFPKNLPKDQVDAVVQQIEKIVTDSGYRVNRKKLHVQRPRRRQKVLGITVNQKIGMNREQYRKYRSMLHNCVKFGFESQLQKAKKENVHQLHSWMTGQLSYLSMIDPDKANKLKLQYELAKQRHPLPQDEFVFKTEKLD